MNTTRTQSTQHRMYPYIMQATGVDVAADV